jgi:rod shape-determining protein MreD
MIDTLPRNIVRFVVLILVQILVFNNIELGGYINPYVYILFILLLPFETPAWITLTSGFILGFIIDIFSETLGMHAAATVFISFIRPYVLSYFSPRDGYETGSYPRVFYYGLTWFVKYTLIMVFAHHLLLFYIEMFKFQDFFATLLRVILSTIFSSTLIIISQFFVFRK